MLNKLLLRFRFVRELVKRCEKAEARNISIAHEMMEKLDDADEKQQRTQHYLDIETTKRTAAEQVAFSRESELDWLREEYRKAQGARDEAIAWQMQALESARLQQVAADAAPTKEQMAQWQPIPKRNQQAVPMIRRAQHDLISGLRKREAEKAAAKATASIHPPLPESVQ